MNSVRKCVGCGERRARDELLRLVVSADGEVVVDASRRLPGRGASICANPRCFRAWLKKKGALSHQWKREVRPVEASVLVSRAFESLDAWILKSNGMGRLARLAREKKDALTRRGSES